MKPILKTPVTQRLKLTCDILLSTSAFRFNLRRYSVGEEAVVWCGPPPGAHLLAGGVTHPYSLTVINARTPLCPISSSLTVCS